MHLKKNGKYFQTTFCNVHYLQVGMYNDLLWESKATFGAAVNQSTNKSILQYLVPKHAVGSLPMLTDSAASKDSPGLSSSLFPAGPQGPSSSNAACGIASLNSKTHVVSDDECMLPFADKSIFGKNNFPVPKQWKLVERKAFGGNEGDGSGVYDICVTTSKTGEQFVRLPIISLRFWSYTQALYANLAFLDDKLALPNMMASCHPVWGMSVRVVWKEGCLGMSDLKKLADDFFAGVRAAEKENWQPLALYNSDEEKKQKKNQRIDQKVFKENTCVVLLPFNRMVTTVDRPMQAFNSASYMSGDPGKLSLPEIMLVELDSPALFDYHIAKYNEFNEPNASAPSTLHYPPLRGFFKPIRDNIITFLDPLFFDVDPVDDCFPTELVNCQSQYKWQNCFQYMKSIDESSFRPIVTNEGKKPLSEDEEFKLKEFMRNVKVAAGAPALVHPPSPRTPRGSAAKNKPKAKGKAKANAKGKSTPRSNPRRRGSKTEESSLFPPTLAATLETVPEEPESKEGGASGDLFAGPDVVE